MAAQAKSVVCDRLFCRPVEQGFPANVVAGFLPFQRERRGERSDDTTADRLLPRAGFARVVHILGVCGSTAVRAGVASGVGGGCCAVAQHPGLAQNVGYVGVW